jgi:hypothetical protein
MCACSYLYTHGYNISLVHLVDSIATPAVKKIMREFTTRKLDTYPTPADYAHAVSVCASLTCRPSALTCPAVPGAAFHGLHAGRLTA